MQASLVAQAAALAGIILEKSGLAFPFVRIIGDALIMGAFIIAITAFHLYAKNRFFGAPQDELMGPGHH